MHRKEAVRLIKLARTLHEERRRGTCRTFDAVTKLLRESAQWYLMREVDNRLDDIERRRGQREAEQEVQS